MCAEAARERPAFRQPRCCAPQLLHGHSDTSKNIPPCPGTQQQVTSPSWMAATLAASPTYVSHHLQKRSWFPAKLNVLNHTEPRRATSQSGRGLLFPEDTERSQLGLEN